ncbi:hypothetical protein AGABI1DRAFT_118100 [Agaricus bisporus var. burnettii JB137-S8]|uniref:Protein kinase domain-containing protein n=1 Tax=Agaricus bisporus var. burnettii (strain JB137-S8 / ATCC MYA-4627 / FGSC 10392) TaxID=597362 RepID=K5Y3V2_AGABU|nr:hypothetical protein AGABI2DRAFT_199360 [Agaricus bisporus var. bisporus H97]XP_007326613.1 uncharacterized protein AGABI1DRAFT_118100 [Agaricus bisporus var. burnettii JB137-S8]EKM82655.1 hypothetical protein AGABI1DRAFT_118100 [Agaricus bisporus var. burnettii JB137-S8]EKV50053.1 hypothetical protein AGABI2DRAFT_199360 [Agaricus bisporus var. bisporus H97]
MQHKWDSDCDSDCSSSCSEFSFDEEETNQRISPYWPKYRSLIYSRGFRLDTIRDVKRFYQNCGQSPRATLSGIDMERGEEALCPDEGLPANLFRGTRVRDGIKIVVKAVQLLSHEYDIIRSLSREPLRGDPRNHTIPVVDLIDHPPDSIGFIVMEEWSSQLITDGGPSCLTLFFAAVRQCIEHAVFMHSLKIAHLDISLRNLLSSDNGRCAYIDFELARRFENDPNPRIVCRRGTEVPPECEQGRLSDPYKIDVWALGVLILRTCKLTGYYVPELVHVVSPMLNERPEARPSSLAVLKAFDKMVPLISEERLETKLRGHGLH